MMRLHLASIPKYRAFFHIKDWLLLLDNEWNIPTHYLHKARQLRDDLLATSGNDVLLHGDLHHDNILFSASKPEQIDDAKNWLVIDPKGVIGEAAYEAAAFIRNPSELVDLVIAPSVINNRITIFAEILKIPAERILGWCFVQAVLSWLWYIEDHERGNMQSISTTSYGEAHFEKLLKIFGQFVAPKL